MAEEVRKEHRTEYQTECRHDSSTNAQTLHRRKVVTTVTHYDDGSSRVTDVNYGDWYSTGAPC